MNRTAAHVAHTHLGAVFPLSLDKNRGLQIVVSARPEGALEKRATLDSCLDLGQRKMLWKQHFTAGDLILMENRKQSTELCLRCGI